VADPLHSPASSSTQAILFRLREGFLQQACLEDLRRLRQHDAFPRNRRVISATSSGRLARFTSFTVSIAGTPKIGPCSGALLQSRA